MKKCKIIVIKIGTKVLTAASGELNAQVLGSIVGQVAKIHAEGAKCVMVTSGAISAGVKIMSLTKRPHKMAKLQAAAACGQSYLMQAYAARFKRHGILTAQILLTQDDFNIRKRYLNLRNTIEELLAMSVIPIINENDSVSTEEIGLGDNDRLASMLAESVSANLMIAATDVDGVFSAKGELIPAWKRSLSAMRTRMVDGHRLVTDIADYSRECVQDTKGFLIGRGGMCSKISMLSALAEFGIDGYIVNGTGKNTIWDAFRGKDVGTSFAGVKVAKGQRGANPVEAKKRWIGFSSKVKGDIIVDLGAKTALLERNSSLLPSGIVRVTGKFSAGDVIGITTPRSKKLFAKGLTQYSSAELVRIAGAKTSEIEKNLGFKRGDEAVHKNNLYIIK